MTKFFEPINVSAVHIYHSALELSPLSSTVRQLYYHQQHTTFPRVVAGTLDSWSQSINITNRGGVPYGYFTWSPCGQYIAASYGQTLVIYDPLSSGLLSTLTNSNTYSIGEVAYSPNGYSLASLSSTGLIIWDIQTGGVVGEIGYNNIHKDEVSLVWSLDGGMISTISTATQLPDLHTGTNYAVHIYNITSGTTWSPSTLQSRDKPHLWSHSKSFQIMITEWDNKTFIVNIYDVGSTLTKVKSFHVNLLDNLVGSLCSSIWGESSGIKSFSPTTYRASALVQKQLWILDIQNSGSLLEQKGDFRSHCFSSDGSLFAASLSGKVHIWKYTSGSYTSWRMFPAKNSHDSPIQFSPTSPLTLHHSWNSLQVWHLDSPPIVAHYDSCMPLAVISHCGTYIVAGFEGKSTITVTNPLSQTPLQFINTETEVEWFALTGNVLLVQGSGAIVAWLLTEEGLVDGVFANKVAGYSSSLWTVHDFPMMFRDQVVTMDWEQRFVRNQVMIMDWEHGFHVYHMGTGEVLKSPQVPPHYQWAPLDVKYGQHYSHYLDLDMCASKGGWPISFTTLQEGWIKDPEGKHQLWIPVEWRMPMQGSTGWLSDITTLWLNCQGRTVIIMF